MTLGDDTFIYTIRMFDHPDIIIQNYADKTLEHGVTISI